MCAAVRHVAPLLPTAIISGRSHDTAPCSHGMDIMGLIRNSEFSGHHAECVRSTVLEGKEVNLFQYTIAEMFKNLSESIKDIDGARMEHNKLCVCVCITETSHGMTTKKFICV